MVFKKTSYKKKSISRRKTYKKKAGSRSKTASLVKLIKKVSLKNSETKYVHVSAENNNMYHNTPFIVNSLVNTQQGIGDNGAGTTVLTSRIGDEVVARGISIKLWIANKLDRPNVMYRVIVYKYQSFSQPVGSVMFKTGTGNKIMDDIDKEYISPIYQKIFNLQVGYSAFPNPTINGDQDGREAHRYIQLWIPLKNKKIHYADASAIPKFTNYGFTLLPYDSYGTLTTDNISSFSYQYKFYFKDP